MSELSGYEQRRQELETLEALYAGWSRGDFSNAVFFTEDVEWIVPRDGPETGSTRGIEGLTASWRAFLDAWEGLQIKAEEVIPGSSGDYVIFQVFRGKGKGSGAETEGKNALFVSMRDGKIARMEGFWDRDEALRAAGIKKGAK